MATRKETFAPGEIYHLYNRGTEKRKIFITNKDYEHFLHLMYVCNTHRNIKISELGENFDRKEKLVEIGAYCLMPNHFHILVKEKEEGGISKYMLKLMTAYTMYFNRKYERTGKLYEGKFQSSYVGSDKYLKYLYSYIHLNPAKIIDKEWKTKKRKNTKVLLEYVFNYKYSSINEYKNSNFVITNPTPFPKYFCKIIEHVNELFEWLNFNK